MYYQSRQLETSVAVNISEAGEARLGQFIDPVG